MGVKENVLDEEVKENVLDEKVKEDVLEEKVKDDVLDKEVTEEVQEEEVKEDILEKEVKDDVLGEEVKENVLEEEVKEEVEAEEVEENVVEEEVKEDVLDEEVKEDVLEEEVKKDVLEVEDKEDVLEEEVKEDVQSEKVKEDVLEEEVKEVVLKQEVKKDIQEEEIKATILDEEVIEKVLDEVVKEDVLDEEVKDEATSDVTEYFKAKEEVEDEDESDDNADDDDVIKDANGCDFKEDKENNTDDEEEGNDETREDTAKEYKSTANQKEAKENVDEKSMSGNDGNEEEHGESIKDPTIEELHSKEKSDEQKTGSEAVTEPESESRTDDDQDTINEKATDEAKVTGHTDVETDNDLIVDEIIDNGDIIEKKININDDNSDIDNWPIASTSDKDLTNDAAREDENEIEFSEMVNEGITDFLQPLANEADNEPTDPEIQQLLIENESEEEALSDHTASINQEVINDQTDIFDQTCDHVIDQDKTFIDFDQLVINARDITDLSSENVKHNFVGDDFDLVFSLNAPTENTAQLKNVDGLESLIEDLTSMTLIEDQKTSALVSECDFNATSRDIDTSDPTINDHSEADTSNGNTDTLQSVYKSPKGDDISHPLNDITILHDDCGSEATNKGNTDATHEKTATLDSVEASARIADRDDPALLPAPTSEDSGNESSDENKAGPSISQETEDSSRSKSTDVIETEIYHDALETLKQIDDANHECSDDESDRISIDYSILDDLEEDVRTPYSEAAGPMKPFISADSANLLGSDDNEYLVSFDTSIEYYPR